MTGAWRDYFGTKVYATHTQHGATFTVLLYAAATARLLAEFEANRLGQIRTGAVSGLATDLLCPMEEVSVACIGSGFQARSQLEAIAAVRKLRSVHVWSRREENRQEFAAAMTEVLDIGVEVAASAEACADGADILVTATYSRDPVIASEAIPPGALVLAMGSNYPDRRELPPELVQAARIVVEDREACQIEAGDLVLALDVSGWERVIELKNLIPGERNPERRSERRTIFKSVGIGLTDVAAAALVLERAGKATTPEQ